MVIITTPGGAQPFTALPLAVLPGWLFGVAASRGKPALRDKIRHYQRECFEMLWNAFKANLLPVPPAGEELTGAALARESGRAIQMLAEQQLALESRVGRGFKVLDQRLITLERQLSAGATISEVQTAEIALAVKTVGQALAAHGDRNGYARVYSEMYRRYRISSHKNLPASGYQEVLTRLSAWYDELQRSAGPDSRTPGSAAAPRRVHEPPARPSRAGLPQRVAQDGEPVGTLVADTVRLRLPHPAPRRLEHLHEGLFIQPAGLPETQRLGDVRGGIRIAQLSAEIQHYSGNVR